MGEGCHLEPDLKWGLQYLEQTLKSSYYTDQPKTLDQLRETLFRKVAENIKTLRIISDVDQNGDTEQLAAELLNDRLGPSFTQKISAKFFKWPILYGILRSVYRLFRRFRV
jgi:hypothetical protein